MAQDPQRMERDAFTLSAGHPLAEVRSRSLQALDFKLKYGLVTAQELIQASPAARPGDGCCRAG